MDTKKLRAKDLMQTDVKMVHKDVTLLTVVKMMRDLGVSSLVVEPDDDGDAFGIITRKDTVEAIVRDANGWVSLTVDDVMTKPAITTNSNLSISNCHQLMRMVGVRRLPVVDRTNLVGILSNSDIFVKLAENIS
jgi:CBS domain-containing protein